MPPRRQTLALLIVIIAASISCTHAASFVSVKNGPWSDPQTWGNSVTSLPQAGDDVLIAPGTTVVLDTDFNASPVLQTLTVQARAVLTCPRNADLPATTAQLGLTIATLRIASGGCVSCGYGNCASDAEPFAGKLTIRLTSPTPPASTNEDVRTLMVESGGSLFFSGAPRVRSVTHLAADADSGESTVRIADSDIVVVPSSRKSNHQPWRVGDRIVLAPTDIFPNQAEYATIVGIEADGRGPATLTLSDPLKYARNGRTLSLTNKAEGDANGDRRARIFDTRAEIALLSRNIVIEGTNDAVTGLGGDLMMAGDDVRARLSWVELRYLGRRGHLARYPLHIHNLGESGRNVYVSNLAIHSSFQRGIVIHCTDGVTLVNNTVAGSPGFAYMLEDGAEENNTLIGNYAIDVRPADYPLIQTERVNSAGFWFVNAANTFVGNVAAGVAGVGFSLDMDPALGSRASMLTTCPERLPGYDAKLMRENKVAEFNTAVNTALIKNNFVRFDDNAVHAAHSGLWMSYSFTPMFFVERPVPIVRFTAWNIAARQVPPSSSLDSSDGVSLHFDGCIRLQGQRGMRIHQLACINPYATATWASCVNTFDGTILAWVDDSALKRSGDGGGSLTAAPPPKPTGFMSTHQEPQIFLRTQIILGGNIAQSSPASAPIFVSLFKGGFLAALNSLADTSIDDRVVARNTPLTSFYNSASDAASPLQSASSPLIRLNAGDMHVFTDATGDAFGYGPGAVVTATYANASGVDPLIEVYAPGRCRSGEYTSKRQSPHVSSSVLPNGRIVAVNAAVPMVCTPTDQGALRFAAIYVLMRGANYVALPMAAAIAVKQGAWPGEHGILRRVSMFPVMVPLTDAAMHPTLGGYTLTFAPETWTNKPTVETIEIAMPSTVRGSDGMSLVIAGLPSVARVSRVQPEGSQVVVEDGTADSCLQIANACAAKSKSSGPDSSLACVCMVRDLLGTVVVRMQAGTSSRNVGIFTNEGKDVGVYDFPAFRMDVV